jgi:hypothetical protein
VTLGREGQEESAEDGGRHGTSTGKWVAFYVIELGFYYCLADDKHVQAVWGSV